jgi:hypothetical protein
MQPSFGPTRRLLARAVARAAAASQRRHRVLQRLRRVFWPSCCSSAANQLGSVPTSKPPCGGRSAPCKRQSEHPQKECQLPKKKRSPLAAGRGIEFRKCLKVSARTCGQTAFDDVPVESGDATYKQTHNQEKRSKREKKDWQSLVRNQEKRSKREKKDWQSLVRNRPK